MKIVSSTWMLCLLLLSNVVVGYQQEESSNVSDDMDMDNKADDKVNDEYEEEEEEEEEDYDEDEDEEEEDGGRHKYDPETEDPLDVCRRNPRWKGEGVDYDTCQKLTGWKPRDELWRDNQFISDKRKERIGHCIDSKWNHATSIFQRDVHPWGACNELDRTKECRVESTKVHGHYKHDDDGDIVTMRNALTEQEALGIEILKDCMHRLLPKQMPYFETRYFGEDEDEDGERIHEDIDSGNTVTYQHELLQTFLPGVASTINRLITESFEKANWGGRFHHPHPSTLGVRTAEYIHYEKMTYLGYHEDTSSVFTISVMLSNPNEYEGGMFNLESGEAMFKVPRLSAIAFQSETLHGITQVTGGERNVFVIELWAREDTPLELDRPTARAFDKYKKNQSGAAAEL